ncbi:IclR family transcriptional regulator [Pararhodobacter marinus]|uniref:IclR family transcriptional regulator n=1 Tax=Pararhodobacter marinus TaxID=2184063 RepID=UPI00351714F6
MKTVDKAMRLLRQFTLEQPEIGLSELARMTGEDKAVTRRLLVALMENGFIEQNPETRKYFLGSGFLSLARLREASVPMVRATQIVARWLSGVSDETVHVNVPGRTSMTTVAYHLPPRGNVINLKPAERYPYHAASSGLAYLARTTPERQAEILALPRERLTPATVIDEPTLRDLVAQARAQGYAVSRNTVEQGVAGVAMAFFLESATDPAGTISITVPEAGLTPDRETELVALLRRAVRNLETALTGRSRSSVL